ncbi:MAG: inositol monophosphatase [Candidatus Woesearchaeota archaeon]|nr:inositol monophosphatase [Candidatus Woesearchaeota archaeon]
MVKKKIKKTEIRGLKQFMIKLARDAGKIAKKEFGKTSDDLKCKVKESDKDQVVCKSDVEVENFIKKWIKKKFPTHGVLAEETEKCEEDSKKEYLWIIDPIDGTRNYVHGHPIFGVSIALARNKEIIAGVVDFPMLGWTFYAEKGRGAERNEKKICVSNRTPGNDTLGNFGCSFHKEKEQQVKSFDRYINVIKKVRIEGAASFGFCLLASGVYDAYIARFIKPWDIAASYIIIKEAGGKVTDFNGNEWCLDSTNIVASNGKFHEKLLEIVKE